MKVFLTFKCLLTPVNGTNTFNPKMFLKITKNLLVAVTLFTFVRRPVPFLHYYCNSKIFFFFQICCVYCKPKRHTVTYNVLKACTSLQQELNNGYPLRKEVKPYYKAYCKSGNLSKIDPNKLFKISSDTVCKPLRKDMNKKGYWGFDKMEKYVWDEFCADFGY